MTVHATGKVKNQKQYLQNFHFRSGGSVGIWGGFSFSVEGGGGGGGGGGRGGPR